MFWMSEKKVQSEEEKINSLYSEGEIFISKNYLNLEDPYFYINKPTMSRFLQAKYGNSKDTMASWTKFVEWHCKFRPDLICPSDPGIQKQLDGCEMTIHGTSRSGASVIYWLSRYATHGMSIDQMLRYSLYVFEQALRHNSKN